MNRLSNVLFRVAARPPTANGLFEKTVRSPAIATKRFIGVSPMSGHRMPPDHSGLWKWERYVSIALLGTIPVALIVPNPVTETAMVTSLVLHSHWGIEAAVIDYVRPIIFGKLIPKLAVGAVFIVSSVTLGGLLYLIYNDRGIVRIIRTIWAKK